MVYKNFNIQKIKKICIFGIVFILLFICIKTLSSYSFISIELPNEDNKITTVYIRNELNNSETFTTTDKSFRKLVRKGDYYVSAQQDIQNGNTLITANGWLTTTQATLELFTEKTRTFVGDNPLPCMTYTSNELISWPCKGNADKSINHEQASQFTPSINKDLSTITSSLFTIQDLLVFNNSTYLLGKNRSDSDDVVAFYSVNLETNTINDIHATKLDGFSPDKDYSVVKNSTDNSVFSHDATELYTFKSPTDYKKISVPKPTNNTYNLHSVSSYEDSRLFVFSNSFNNELSGSSIFISTSEEQEFSSGNPLELDVFDASQEDENISTEIIISNEAGESSYVIDQDISQARLCGDKHICVLANKLLTVYERVDNVLSVSYTIPDVTQIESNGTELLFVDTIGVATLNTTSKQSYYQYTFGDYVYCGMRSLRSQYIVCIDNQSNQPRRFSTLLIDPSSDVTQNNNIDKKILPLIKSGYIDTISIYKKFVHILPTVKRDFYSQEVNGFTYDPTKLKQANDAINDLVEQSAIPDTYNIINILNNT